MTTVWRALLLAVLVLGGFCAPSSAAPAPVFVVTGKGYGHGIGMSQYGAQGFALHGWSYDDILEHYYRDAAVTAGQPNDPVKVLVSAGRVSLTIGSDAAFEVAGELLSAGTYTVRPLPAQVEVVGNGTAKTVGSPATFTPGTAPLELGTIAYRGALVVASSPSGALLSALNTLPRESYIRGVVPREMPASWSAEALKVQAVAARTYSLAGSGHCVWEASSGVSIFPASPQASFVASPVLATEPVFCPDTRDQVYGGRSAETAATNEAVQATAGEAVTYGGDVAATYFFSTSGGKTAAKADEWGGASVPYLVSVDDPYDSISPHHAWGPKDLEVDCPRVSPDCVYTASEVRAALGLAWSPLDLRVTGRNASGRVSELTAAAAVQTTPFAGTAARTKLGLRSTWFFVGVLSLDSSQSTVTYGRTVRLDGVSRSGSTSGWGTARLQAKRYGATTWTSVGAALPNGSWSRTAEPSVTTSYRVVSGNATGVSKRVSVRTKVTFWTPRAPYTALVAQVRPVKPQIAVTLRRRRADGTWALVSTVRTNIRGNATFRISGFGTYRASADVGAGFLPGVDLVTVPPHYP